ncbi:MAG: double-cubane-cluster-containing anaerobic reductase [Dehalococcoidia bacterium]|nr:double-cubane-cluster-containing anaerobic reductase [Dehalococcoidia bacterium]
MSDYRQMWADLGLDLEKHDLLLGALPAIYENIYLSQENRPEGMGYFDFVISEIHGLRVKELMDHKAKGGKVIGTYCVFVPEDVVLAAGGVPVGLCAGAQFSIPDAEGVLPNNTCALIKSSFGFKVGRTCPYVQASDLVVGETTCDGKKKMYELLAEHHPTYVMEVPQKKTASARALFFDEILHFRDRVEAETGVRITPDSLTAATSLVDSKKTALQRFNAARKVASLPISGLDALLVNQVSFYDDVVRFTDKVNALSDELESRIKHGQSVFSDGAPRLLVAGSPMAIPNWKVHRVLEDSGAAVVAEESCIGFRYYNYLTGESDGTMEGQLRAIADRLLENHCACFTPNEERVQDILNLANEYSVDGVVQYSLSFCQPYANEAVKVGRALTAAKIPVLNIETDYNDGDMGQMKARVDAFLEMIKDR